MLLVLYQFYTSHEVYLNNGNNDIKKLFSIKATLILREPVCLSNRK